MGTRTEMIALTTRWLRPVALLLAFAAGYFGVLPYLVPQMGADISGFKGYDVYFYRLTGAASFGYAVALVVGLRSGWRGVRIPIGSMAVFAVGSILACLVAILDGGAPLLVYVVLLASSLFLSLHLWLLRNPPTVGAPVGSSAPDISDRFAYLIGFAGLGALGTGSIALLLGGRTGELFGYTGADGFVYRQLGAAVLGYALSGLLMLRSRRWAELKGATCGALAFNAFSALATLVELPRQGGVNLLSIIVLGVSVAVSAGMTVALRGSGR